MNPFRIEAIQPGQPFCDRLDELARLLGHAESFQNVMLSSPRRYGKTSLALRVQDELRKDGWGCMRVDFFGVDSVEDVARRIGRGLIQALDARESLLGKGKRFLRGLTAFRPVFSLEESGPSVSVQRIPETLSPADLLANTLDDLAGVVKTAGFKLHVVFDEFQEITRLGDSGQIEGIMRAAIQGQDAAYLFLGSRRGVLRAMFNERKRPLFQSALPMALGPLPAPDAAAFLVEQFAKGGKRIATDDATALCAMVECYPYYVQRLAAEVFQMSAKQVTADDLRAGLRAVIGAERYGYQAVLSGLTPRQTKVLRTIARTPPTELQGAAFVAHAGAPVSSIAQTAKKLLEEDIIEKPETAPWRVVDPVFAQWLREM